MNVLAIASFVLSFLGVILLPASLGAVVCGHIALDQVRRDGATGRQFALAGTIIGYAVTAIWLIAPFLVLVTLGFATRH